MKAYRSNRKGFTLVEILIVVIILGILAAIVIPQFTNASEDARKSSLTSQLQSMRSQIALYKLQHRDTPPPSATFWDLMTKQTDDAGNAYTAGTSTTGPFGPYFQANVNNPLTNKDAILDAAAGTSSTGWLYDHTTGEVHGVDKNGGISDDGTNTATWSSSSAYHS